MNATRRVGALVLAATASLVAGVLVPHPSAQAREPASPNVVVILTDDQRADEIADMPNVQAELVDHGVTFDEGYVTNSLCCPSRASTLTGTYNHTNGVYFNNPPNGGYGEFVRNGNESSTVATWLQGAGYRTGLFGKYLNGYESSVPAPPPPGWDRWFAFAPPGYRHVDVNDDGMMRNFGAEYQTDVIGDAFDGFVASTPDDQPLFAYVAPYLPHEPMTPQGKYRHSFDDLSPWRPPSYNENDVSDKPKWLRRQPLLSPQETSRDDRLRRRQYATLLSGDDLVGRIIDDLQAAGRLDNTLVIYTSDNGFEWGEHRLWGKNTPYEESVRVPYIVRADFLVPGGTVSHALALNIDTAVTAAAVAGATPTRAVDGESLVPVLAGGAGARSRFLIEHGAEGSGGGQVPAYCAVHTHSQVFVRYASGEEEFYDLRHDPDQLRNRAATSHVARLRRQDRQLCSPLPPGMIPF